jgi:hypothetical protein
MAYRYPYDDEVKTYQPPKLETNRSVGKLVLFSILTLGLYSIFFFIPFSFDLDKIAPKQDRSKTTNFLLAYVASIFTVSIVLDIWHYQIAARISEALELCDIDYDFGTEDFWGWFFFGSLILVGPIVYFYKLCKAMNLLCAHYNEHPTLDA